KLNPSKFLSIKQKYVDALMQGLDRQLEDKQALLKELTYDKVVRDGTAYVRIIEYAQENQYDLIVIGNHGKKGKEGLFLGKTASRIVRQSAIPVLTIKVAPEQPDWKSLRRMVVPTDFSAPSREAIHLAIDLAKVARAHITFLNIR